MTDEKIINIVRSYKRGLDKIKEAKVKFLDKPFNAVFKVDGTEIKQTYEEGYFVPDVDDITLNNWIKINYMLNEAWKENKDLVDEEMKRVGLN